MWDTKCLSVNKHTDQSIRVQRADKGGASVVISEGRMHAVSRVHVENDKAYELASGFGP